MSDEEMKAELERLRNENTALKKGASTGIRMKVSEKGAVSIYGMGRFPVTLYKEQWLKLLDMATEIRAFIAANDAQLKKKDSVRKRHAEILAQHRPFIFRAKQAAALQFRDDQIDEVVDRAGHMRRQQVEAVGGLLDEPLLQLVGDRRGRADQGPMVFAGGRPHRDLAQRQVVAARQPDVVRGVLIRAALPWTLRHRLIEREARQIDPAEHAGPAASPRPGSE